MKTIISLRIYLLLGLLLLSGCQPSTLCFDADIVYDQPLCFVKNLPSPFSPITREEFRQDWGKELVIASTFAGELDFYRAITSYKRALILIPDKFVNRRLQIEYGILECYYLGGKYQEVLDTFEPSTLLTSVPKEFPAIDDLLMMVYDAYERTEQYEKACRTLEILRSRDPNKAQQIETSQAIQTGDLAAVRCLATNNDCIQDFYNTYQTSKLSVRQAQVLNAILPGAGYLYVGQKQSALTSFCINALFIAAAYQFFNHGNTAAGIITSSLELGWYLGGINGAGIEANEFNKRIYDTFGKQTLLQAKLFPVLMLKYGF